jgi:hypothetical protein
MKLLFLDSGEEILESLSAGLYVCHDKSFELASPGIS